MLSSPHVRSGSHREEAADFSCVVLIGVGVGQWIKLSGTEDCHEIQKNLPNNQACPVIECADLLGGGGLRSLGWTSSSVDRLTS